MLIGNRVPHDFFLTQGSGESDVTIHAGSYHLALRQAGIEMCNILGYSSILPATATRIAQPPHTHGEVMETIMAAASCETGETATAGIIFAWLKDSRGRRHGGLVCEYSGGKHPEEVVPHLRDMLDELHSNGYEQYELSTARYLIETVTPAKRYGTALCALCFTSYDVPL